MIKFLHELKDWFVTGDTKFQLKMMMASVNELLTTNQKLMEYKFFPVSIKILMITVSEST